MTAAGRGTRVVARAGNMGRSQAPARAARKPALRLLTLAIDIGGSHIKASVLSPAGIMLSRPVRIDTPHPAKPAAVLDAIADLVAPLPLYRRIAAGFPGAVRDGRVLTAPNLGTAHWHGFPLAEALAERLKRPARVLNDADVQGLGVIDGKGLECVLTLGTGVGSSLFQDGLLLPHLELGQHPIFNNKTYDEYLGAAAFEKKGRRKWNRRLLKAIPVVHRLTNYDLLHLGGGNARMIDVALPAKVKLAANVAGITGGIRVWDQALDPLFAGAGRGRGTFAGRPR
jgi:polyphosphate glucokinase